MQRQHHPNPTTTQHLLGYALEIHAVPEKTAARLAKQFSEAHLLRQLSYYSFECGRRPQDDTDWHYLVLRIRQQLPAPPGYPFPNPD